MRKLKGKSCYLCGNRINSDEDGSYDHIPPRNLFPEKPTGNLITVPTHKACNNALSNHDETFRNFLLSSRDVHDTPVAKELYRSKVRKSFNNHPIGQRKRNYLSERLRETVVTDDGERIEGPLLLIEEENPALMPQFERIIKGLYYHKLKKPLLSNVTMEIHFRNIDDFNGLDFRPHWHEVENNVFRYFLHTQEGDDTKGMAGLLFYEKVFLIGFF